MHAPRRCLILAAMLVPGLATAATVVVQHTGSIAANAADTVSVSCPAGMQALGGGIIPANVFQSEIGANAPLYGSTPLLSMPAGTAVAPNGWYGVVHSFLNVAMNATVAAICTTDPGVTSVIAASGIPAASGAQATFGGLLPACPAGLVATGGGGDSSDHALIKVTGSSPLLSTTLPDGYPGYGHPDGVYGAPVGWNTFFRTQRTSPGTIAVAAVCAPYSGIVTALHHFSVPATSLPVGAAGAATCPAGKVAIGGGMDFDNVLTGVTVYSLPSVAGTSPPAHSARPDGTYPLPDSWLGSFYSYVTTGFAATVVAICADAPQAVATLFHNTGLDHYFMTSDPAEVAAIGNGAAGPGWTQLAERFVVVARGNYAAGSGDVCRFYGTPGIGPNSHFYTIDPDECAAVKRDPGWTYEAIAFRAFHPVAQGACPAGTINVYRLYNNRFAFNDSNHRYTTSTGTVATMAGLGWKDEGTVFCAIAAP